MMAVITKITPSPISLTILAPTLSRAEEISSPSSPMARIMSGQKATSRQTADNEDDGEQYGGGKEELQERIAGAFAGFLLR